MTFPLVLKGNYWKYFLNKKNGDALLVGRQSTGTAVDSPMPLTH